MTDTEARERVWSCRIEGPAGPLAPGADFPMRIAVRKAYAEVTGASPTELSSGWTSVLTPADAPSDLRAAAQEVVRIGVLWSGKPDYDDAQAALIDAITALRAALSGDRPSPRPCARYFGSDGTLCSTHGGHFGSVASNHCGLSGDRPSPEADHAAQSAAGTHLYDENCPLCASPATAPAEGLDVDNDDFRDDHERAMRDHVIANFGISPQHICDDLCSDDIVSRLAARLAPDSAQEPR